MGQLIGRTARLGHFLLLAVIRGSQLSGEACNDYCIRLSQLLLQSGCALL